MFPLLLPGRPWDNVMTLLTLSTAVLFTAHLVYRWVVLDDFSLGLMLATACMIISFLCRLIYNRSFRKEEASREAP